MDAGLGKISALTAPHDEPHGPLALLRAPSLRSALDVLTARSFDCVVVDLDLPGAASADAWQELRRAAAGAALLALADHHGHEDHPGAQLADDVVVRSELATPDAHRTVLRTVRQVRLAGELQRAEESARLLSAIVDATPDAVFSKSVDGVITSWNRGAQQLYGYTPEEIVGEHVSILHPPGVEEYAPIMSVLLRGESVRALETVRLTKDGRMVDVSLTVCPVYGGTGELSGASVVARNISDRRELETELVRAFMHDGLTGLPNRAFLVDRLSRLLAQSATTGSPVAVFFLDLDDFKRINEAQGHFAGDRVLGEVATRLGGVVRPVDTVARLGGDEFVLVCPDTDMEAAARFAQRIIEELSRPVRLEGRAVHISASVGIAVSPPLEADAEGLLRHADAAMYEAKARGRSRSQIFDVSFAERSRDQLRLAGDLREALAHDLLDVHYQPVIGLAGSGLVGFEALARWEHPTRGQVPPGVFVPLAEHSGFISELDQWVLRRACRDTRTGRAAGLLPRDARVSVNLSARSLGDPDLVRIVHDILLAEELPPQALILEITETALMQDIEQARLSLEGLRTLGAGVALDDFGTGYSSLSFLRELPVTQVKIDRSFIAHIAGNGEDLLITQSIVDLARGLGLETVAEGVETQEQLALLNRLGCTSAQGHLWSPAVPLDRLAAPDRRTPAGVEVAPLALRGRHADRGGRRWVRGRRRHLADTAPHRASEATVHDPVAASVRAGLDAGEAWLVIAVAEHRAALRTGLGPSHAPAVARGDYVELDAAEVLDAISPDGVPDTERFERLVGDVVRRLHARGPVRIYSELSGLLLRGREVPAALAMEDLWSGLEQTIDLTVWCGYDPDDPAAREHASLCTRHEHVAWPGAPLRDSTAS
ncbi:hypothetical protein GCM10009844_12610 [Nocardioides koreensis]|uniref:EAL domain-containing protein n=1 Tax=Nocardioides koreensis TaxID=433651 RepID=A0ABP5L596_9ACTN